MRGRLAKPVPVSTLALAEPRTFVKCGDCSAPASHWIVAPDGDAVCAQCPECGDAQLLRFEVARVAGWSLRKIHASEPTDVNQNTPRASSQPAPMNKAPGANPLNPSPHDGHAAPHGTGDRRTRRRCTACGPRADSSLAALTGGEASSHRVGPSAGSKRDEVCPTATDGCRGAFSLRGRA